MTLLVVGRGLLGTRVAAAAEARGIVVLGVRVPWEEPAAALDALLAAAASAAAEDPDWDLAWCAGAGVVATAEEDLAAEVALFRGFVSRVRPAPRTFFLSSSAGGLYAGSAGPPFTEAHEPRPLAPYGRAKLAMEEASDELAAAGTRVLLGRIANLYGPGQDLEKQQGLISQLCLTHVTGRPLRLYVSFDSLRDYVYVDDAADLVLAMLARGATLEPGSIVVKILASGTPTSVAVLVDACVRAFRRRPHVVQCATTGGAQVLDLRLRSGVWPDLDAALHTPLLVGLRATADDVEARHRAGELARQLG
ncbi:NAD-dependent epimerase/dehydratase family protein [Nocardioides sp. W7]|uniref:NAD-dependent epimerase/dehydratase family protein n=1 Tax=Nocardioides sp. W7 TaxID=2931390 RepID=UPI001FD4D59B|nr:NAD-dependent epimerase/dehydratase family protein [Nocardioides sp. W7]